MMHRIVLQVDSSECFDRMHEFGTDAGAIGIRLMMPLIVGELPDMTDRIGLAMYGITVESVEKIAALRASTEEGKTATPSVTEGDAARVQVLANGSRQPLPWYRPEGAEFLMRANTVLGVYRIWTHHEANGEWYWEFDDFARGDVVRGEGSSEFEVKSAAQSDYDRRDRSASATPSVKDEEAGRS